MVQLKMPVWGVNLCSMTFENVGECEQNASQL
jgi:hypothetical protein